MLRKFLNNIRNLSDKTKLHLQWNVNPEYMCNRQQVVTFYCILAIHLRNV